MPLDIGIDAEDELLDRDALPVSRIEQFCFLSSEETFAGVYRIG